MTAGQPDGSQRHEVRGRDGVAPDDVVALHRDAFGHTRVEREITPACPALSSERQRGRIVRVDDRPVGRRLVGKDPGLRRAVLLE
jgi:hypothetical protein